MPIEIAVIADAEALKSKLLEILQEWPLYRPFYYNGHHTSILPELIQLYCDDPLCESLTRWETYIGQQPNHGGWYKSKEYVCKNCSRSKTVFYYNWTARQDKFSFFTKIGQWPELETRISKALKRHLHESNDHELYQKALRCRKQNLGIGAVSYLRRLVENKTNELLDMIAEQAALENFAADELKKIEDVKKSWRFSDKIDYAKHIIPPTLKAPHNPLDELHDLTSEVIHHKSEEQCMEAFDKARVVFEYLFIELDRRKTGAAEFKKALAEIANRK
jgi:hypothetical protein